MPVDLYGVLRGSPTRTVLLAAKAIGVEINLILVDMNKEEHLTPELLKMNPQHTLPTMNDNGFYLWESRAIVTYLQNQYGKNDNLYPTDAKKRALIDQRLYFDLGTLYGSYSDYYYPIIHGKTPDPEKFVKLKEALKFLDTFLTNSEYAAGDSLTLADLAIVSTVSTIEVLDYKLTGNENFLSSYKNIVRWYDKVKATAVGYEETIDKNLIVLKQTL